MMMPVAICFVILQRKICAFHGPFGYSEQTTWSSVNNVRCIV